MTPISVPVRLATVAAVVRLSASLLVLAVALSACSSSAAETADDDVVEPSKDSVDADIDDGGGAGPGAEDGRAPDTTDPAMPPPATPDEDDDEAVRPPGTVNELDDLIGNESDDGLAGSSDGSLIDRFVRALLADTGGLDIAEADARCAGERIGAELSTTSFELLVDNLETLNEIEEGRQFTDAELLVISEGLAGCIDFRPIVDEIVDDDANIGLLVDCLAARLDVDAVESLLLFELLGENGDRPTSVLVLRGLELCPTEARTVIDATILREFLLDDAPQIEACLADIDNAELRPFFETRELGELIGILREQCLF